MKTAKVKINFRFIIVLACAIGLLIKTGILFGDFKGYTLIYYTNLSNLLVAMTFLTLLFWKKANSSTLFIRFKGAVTVMILLTGIVYHFVLVPNYPAFSGISTLDIIGNILLHYVTPIMVLLDWMFWDRKGVFLIKDPFLWLSIPFLYFLFTVLQAQLGAFIPNQAGRYPYNFIAVDLFGWLYVLKNILIIGVFYLLLSFFLLALDRLFLHLLKKYVD